MAPRVSNIARFGAKFSSSARQSDLMILPAASPTKWLPLSANLGADPETEWVISWELRNSEGYSQQIRARAKVKSSHPGTSTSPDARRVPSTHYAITCCRTKIMTERGLSRRHESGTRRRVEELPRITNH